MRTNIDIDDKLMKKAMKASGAATKKATVEEALHLLVQSKARAGITRWIGKVQFWDDYDPKALSKDKWAEAEKRWKEDQRAAELVAKPSRKKAA